MSTTETAIRTPESSSQLTTCCNACIRGRDSMVTLYVGSGSRRWQCGSPCDSASCGYNSAMNQSDGAGVTTDITFSLLGAAHAVEDRIESSLTPLGLSLAKLNVLGILVGSNTPLTLGELAQRLACVRSNVTQLV